jgi:hypothetical protein
VFSIKKGVITLVKSDDVDADEIKRKADCFDPNLADSSQNIHRRVRRITGNSWSSVIRRHYFLGVKNNVNL